MENGADRQKTRVFSDADRHATSRIVHAAATCLSGSRQLGGFVVGDVLVGGGREACQGMRLVAVADAGAAAECRRRRRLRSTSTAGAAASGGITTAVGRGADVLYDRRLQDHRVGSGDVSRRRTGSTSRSRRRSDRDAVVKMMMLVGAFHVHLEPNTSTSSCSFPLNVVVIHTNCLRNKTALTRKTEHSPVAVTSSIPNCFYGRPLYRSKHPTMLSGCPSRPSVSTCVRTRSYELFFCVR